MSLFQKMSARDRSLMILLAAAILFFLSYTYVISPQLANAEVLKGELLSIQSELDRADQLKGQTDDLKKQEKQQRGELIKKYSNFFFDLDQSRLLNKVDMIHVGAGLPAESYLATPETPSQVTVEKGVYTPPQYPLKDMASKINPDMASTGDSSSQDGAAPAGNSQQSGVENPANQEAVESSDMILGTDVTVGFNGATYEGIYNFIAAVEKMNKTVVLKSISISKDETGLTGQLIFAFYSLPKLDPDQKDGLDYTPSIPAGKANPFI